jgi:5-methyltetrahydropteroyltriglutamate--homocysteine methyltransferase
LRRTKTGDARLLRKAAQRFRQIGEDTMANRILTTHVGSLPRPAQFVEVAQKRTLGKEFDQAAYEKGLKDGVAEVVQKQKEAGVDLINDGELAHTMGWAYDYGA